MPEEYVNGHRSRLKEKFRRGGFGFAYDYELLELLLTYSIPRKDVKPIAKRLLLRFKDLKGVFEAEQTELKEVSGIGDSSAALISLLSEIKRRAFSEGRAKSTALTNEAQRIEYCRQALEALPDGSKFLITLNNSDCVLTCNEITKPNEGSLKELGRLALQSHAAKVIIAEKQNTYNPLPSAGTVSCVIRLISFFGDIKVDFGDYVLIGKGTGFSMRGSELFNNYFR